ncbi:hypothetical protein [Candidatus Nitrosotalea okcheonensis]|uniref:HEPN domain-containing protein n=1 Tax=Candidatus Nitrosotalea okcheonensis TaxID=1903276 RepID=A0A2H1FEZ3_9ARCH|nr:hypothetical protein [Candidatus Nitrosotalea okcheonensis]SMH71330.1 protein of unknown function [Candidatus Nitrosotalea okcheonensis]
MVTKTDTHELLHFIDHLSNLNTLFDDFPDFKEESSKIYVRTSGGIADSFETLLERLDNIGEKIEKVDGVKSSIRRWINRLDKNYSEDEGTNLPVYLTKEDAKALRKETQKWLDKIIESFDNSGTAIIKENQINEVFSKEIMDRLDNDAQKDLKEGIDVLLHGYPTAATMILFRMAERMIRELYKNTTGKEVGKETWGHMLTAIGQHEDFQKNDDNKVLMGYLYYLNKKRINAAHPYRRYTQEEAERILLQIKDMLEEIHHRK